MEFTGRITADAKVTTVKGDKEVVNFSVAINDSYKNRQGERVQLTEFVDCSYWRTMAVAGILNCNVLLATQILKLTCC